MESHLVFITGCWPSPSRYIDDEAGADVNDDQASRDDNEELGSLEDFIEDDLSEYERAEKKKKKQQQTKKPT